MKISKYSTPLSFEKCKFKNDMPISPIDRLCLNENNIKLFKEIHVFSHC